MRRILTTLLAGTVVSALPAPTPAEAQRANENAVAAAQDAFGTSVGNERVGIYTPFGARGFSPVQAGNVRIEGLYFDLQSDLSDRLIAGSNVRVGLSAQSYPFAAPTGIADFSLRKANGEAVLSTLAGYGPFGGARLELDGQIPVSPNLSIAAGAGFNREELHFGGDRTALNAAVVARVKPAKGIEILPFWSIQDVSGQEPLALIYTAGAYLPPRIERRVYFGQEWARSEYRQVNYGVTSTAAIGAWTVRAGLFRSLLDNPRNFSEIADKTTADGIADRYVIAEKDRKFGSFSGEVRLSRSLVEGDRLHTLHLMGRGRERKRRYGGGQIVPMGRGPIDEPMPVPEPDFTFGPQTRDSVRQLTGGIGYEARWRGVGEMSVGLQKTHYRKEVETPAGPLPVSSDSPWLLSATASLYAGKDLVFYAGYSKGLEESPVAPAVARNRDEAPPALLTRQVDAGLRWAITDKVRLVAGVFDVSKPYYGLDQTMLFARLGTVSHRGVELSLAGQILPNLNAVVGTVFLDAELSGAEADQGLVGRRPVNAAGRTTTASIEYRVPWAEGLSLDIGIESTSRRTANRDNTLFVPARYVLAPGMRYRFRIGDNPATFRAQMANAADTYGYGIVGEGFSYNLPRRFSMSLVVDA